MSKETAVSATAAVKQKDFIRKRVTVGSAGTGITYNAAERVFHSSDMPEKARQARQEVKQKVIDSMKGTVWNSSVAVVAPRSPGLMTNFAYDHDEYEYNFRAEELPRGRTIEKDSFGRSKGLIYDLKKDGHIRRAQEMPIHKDLEKAPQFVAGGSFSLKEWKEGHERLRAKSLERTKRATERILAKTGHKNPVEREKDFMDDLRKTRSMLTAARTMGVAASPGLSSSGSFDATGLPNEPAIEPFREFDMGVQIGRPKKTKDTSKLMRKYWHEGSYGPIPAEPDTNAWSCCGALTMEAQGCASKAIDPDRMCTLSI